MSDSSFWKWLSGIVGGVITGVLIWWLTSKKVEPNQPKIEPPQRKVTSAIAPACRISGRVINKDNNQPLPDIEVHYFRFTQDANPYQHSVKSILATTDIDGRFSADCSSIEPQNFPLELELTSPNWGILKAGTNQYIPANTVKTDIILYVSDGLNRKIK